MCQSPFELIALCQMKICFSYDSQLTRNTYSIKHSHAELIKTEIEMTTDKPIRKK